MKSRLIVALALAATALPARAERPVTYREALEASVENNPSLQRSQISRDQSEAGLRSANGTFDPTYNLNGFYGTSTSQQFFGGGQLEFQNKNWGITNSLQGTAPTGTTVELSQNLAYNQFEFPLEVNGVLLGTQTDEAYNGSLNASVTQQLLRGLSFKYNLENVTIARRQMEVADLNLEKQRQDTLAQAAQAYWNYVYQASLAEITGDSVEVAREALRVVTQNIQGLPNHLVVEGHTDAASYGSGSYSNWELSVDRANSARRLLIEFGLAESRIQEVRGHADRELLVPDAPQDPSNRRVTILIPYLQPEDTGDDPSEMESPVGS